MTIRSPFKFIWLLILLTTTVQFSAQATESSHNQCTKASSNSELCQINIKQGERSFGYKYEIKRALQGAPTLIAIPGGPGQGLIGSMSMVKYGDFIPDDFGVILIDPRGTGQNDFGADPNGELYTTKNVAADIIEIIRHESLTNYFIHGQSYGTVVATVLGSLLSKSKLPQARGIILSGVVAKAFEDPLAGYNFQLHRLFSFYSADQQESLRSNLMKLREEFGENERVFAALFINVLTSNVEDPSADGKNNINMRKFFDMLAEGSFESSNQALKFFQETAKQVGKVQKPKVIQRRNNMPEVIKCHELTRIDGMHDLYFDFASFQIVSKFSDCQKKGYSLDRPFISENYQIKEIPIFYIQGLLDPATPVQGAKYHYDHQHTKNKVFVQLDNYAHTALIGLWPCKDNLWKSLSGGASSLKEHIRSCNKPEIRVLD